MNVTEVIEHENGEATYSLEVSAEELQTIFQSFVTSALASMVIRKNEDVEAKKQLLVIDQFLDSAESTQVRNWVLKKLNKIVERIENEK